MIPKNDTFPCKNCGDRKAGCHGSCEKYATAKAMYDKQVADYKEVEGRNDIIDDFKIATVIRTRDKYRRKR